MKVIKEIFVSILILAIIIVITMLVLQDKLPNGKTVAEVRAYQKSTIVKDLDEENKKMEDEEVKKVFSLKSSDIDKYEAQPRFDQGRINPFEDFTEVKTDEDGNPIETENIGPNDLNTSTSEETKGYLFEQHSSGGK